MRAAVIIMSRVPRPGQTKTRLMPYISAQECANFQRAALRDTYHAVRQAAPCVYLYYADDQIDTNHKPELYLFDPLWSLPEDATHCLKMRSQQGNDLGERMQNAARELLLEYDAVVLVGSDAPTLSPRHIQQTLTQLGSYDLVLGPADDGGYYLLAMKKVHDELFTEIPWGTAGVLKETLAKASGLKLSYALLEPLADIDTWQDLLRFVQTGMVSADGCAKLEAFQYAQYLFEKYAGVAKEREL